ncbi:MAG: hypothetical protein MUD12_01240 [Spirochaetes bacterium]|nr:hypothetical protein [Spirochaetota bacterium]
MLLFSFYAGFASAISQVIIIRELLNVFRGNELIVSIIFFSWFLGLFLGAKINRGKTGCRSASLPFLLAVFPLLFLSSVILTGLIPFIFPRMPGTYYSLSAEFLLAGVFTFPVSYLAGYLYPALVFLISPADDIASGGRIYFVESAGSFAGGLAFSFLIINFMNPLETGAVLLFCPFLYIALKSGKRALLLLILPPVILFLWSPYLEKNINSLSWNKTGAGTLIESWRSRYQTIFVESQQNEIINIYGNRLYYYSLPDAGDMRQVFHLIQSLRTKKDEKILLLGGSPGSLPLNLLKTGVREISCVELDPDLWRISEKYRGRFYPVLSKSSGFRIHYEDARAFLSNNGEKFDIILCFPPHPENTMLNRLFTAEFYSLCKSRLNDGGFMLTSLKGFANIMNADLKNYISSILKAYKRSFPYTMNTTGDTVYLIGSADRESLPPSPEVLIERYAKRFKTLDFRNLDEGLILNYTPDELKMMFEKSQLDYFQKNITAGIHMAQENLDLNPRAYWNYNMLLMEEEGGIVYRLLRLYYLLPLLAAAIVIPVFFRIWNTYGRKKFSVAVSIFTVGFTSISFMLLMLMLYQTFFGIMFYRISLINALFMFGLASGSYSANRFRLSSVPMFAFLVLGLLSVFLFLESRAETIFWFLILFLSTVFGGLFASLYACLDPEDHQDAASFLYSTDNLGAMIGSILTALFLIPHFGIGPSIGINIALIVSAMIYFRISAHS